VALPTEAEVVRRLVAWAERDDAIRALVLTSSRARADGSVDALSDYDVVIAVRDPRAFAEDDAWKSAYGRLLVGWGDENRVHGETTYFRGVVYDDGAKIDYTLWPDVLLERVADSAPLPADLDVGYRVLLDKDGQTTRWSAPTLRAHIPPKPTHGEYVALVEEFWWDTTYVAKSLWRGEAFFAKFALDFGREVRRPAEDARVADRARPRLVAQARIARTRPRTAPTAGRLGRAGGDVRRHRHRRELGRALPDDGVVSSGCVRGGPGARLPLSRGRR
jgi:hypothetical protein